MVFSVEEIRPDLGKYYSKSNTLSLSEVSITLKEEFLWVCPRCGKDFSKKLNLMLKAKNSYCKICNAAMSKFTISLKEKYPEVAKMYDEGGNDIPSNMISPNSKGNFKFLCRNMGEPHIFTSSLNHAVRGYYNYRSKGCPICAGKYIVAGVNDLKSQEPELVKMYSKNNTLSPDKIGWRDAKTLVKWVCSKGHEFTQTVNAQKEYINTKYQGCPYCSGREVEKGKNDLATLYPDVFSMWDWKKNTVNPYAITGRSYKEKCWFICPKGHSFQALTYGVIHSRKNSTRGCPYCANQKVLKGYNDLESVHPELLKYWDCDKNDVSPDSVICNDQNNKYWFKCDEGHSFESTVYIIMGSQKYKTKGCPICANKKVVVGVNDIFSTNPELRDSFPYDLNPDINPEDYVVGSEKLINCHCSNPDCGNIFQTTIYNWANNFVKYCPDCMDCGKSYEAHMLAEVIRTWGIEDVLEEYPLFEDSRRVDIFIKSKNLVIEYNGLYWHNEEIRDKNFHLKRYLDCKKLGYNLIYVWQDDWKYKRDIVESFLKRKIGISEELKVNARDCIVELIDYTDAYVFLEDNHIQGATTGDAYIALLENNMVRAVCVIQGIDDAILIKRYATDCILRGGFSKIISFIEKTYEFSQIDTFSDNGVSDGLLYKNLGFVKVKDLRPDYKYIVNHRRVHKFNYRKDRFKKDSNLDYREGLSETELADLNGLKRIWDAGKVKWSKFYK